MHNASRQIKGKANSHDARREPRIVLLRRFHRDEVFGGEDVGDVGDVGPDADDPDDELDGADVDEEKMVDEDAYVGILSTRLALLDENVEERDREPIEASWCARTSSRRTSKEEMRLGEARGLSSSGKISTNLEGILLVY